VAVLAHAIEYLHPRPLATSVTYDEASALYQDSNFPRVPEKTLGLTLVAEHVLEHAIFIENLNPVVVSVRHHDVFVSAQAEPMGGVELTFFSTKLPELRPYLHLLHSWRWATAQHFCIWALANSTLVDLQTGKGNVVPATPSSAQAFIKWFDRFTTMRTLSNTAHLTSDCLARVAPTDVYMIAIGATDASVTTSVWSIGR